MYTEYQPSHLLVPYIDSYWEFKGNPDYGMRIHILPDGCTDFIFTLGEVANAVEEGSLIMQPYRSYFVGPMTWTKWKIRDHLPPPVQIKLIP